jgi:hypothetical protein
MDSFLARKMVADGAFFSVLATLTILRVAHPLLPVLVKPSN